MWNRVKRAHASHIDIGDAIGAAFEGILGRDIAASDLPAYVQATTDRATLTRLIADLVASPEFKSSRRDESVVELPDLRRLYPDRYSLDRSGNVIFHARDDAGIAVMEQLIGQHRYYESFGVWQPVIDTDKKVIAAIVEGLGARSCIELGCYSGSVLSLLKERGIRVRGVELSHRAFLLAHPNIYHDLTYGTLLDDAVTGTYDLFLAMDVLEHISPLLLDRCAAKIHDLIGQEGLAFINSPMFGPDDVFGNPFPVYMDAWLAAGEHHYWYDMHCDEKGWPMHGHLVWASPAWWEALFLRHGLVRDRPAERILHGLIGAYNHRDAPARQSVFILRDRSAQRTISEDELRASLRQVPGVLA